MTMDKSLKVQRGMIRSRSVLNRAERIAPEGLGPLEGRR